MAQTIDCYKLQIISISTLSKLSHFNSHKFHTKNTFDQNLILCQYLNFQSSKCLTLQRKFARQKSARVGVITLCSLTKSLINYCKAGLPKSYTTNTPPTTKDQISWGCMPVGLAHKPTPSQRNQSWCNGSVLKFINKMEGISFLHPWRIGEDGKSIHVIEIIKYFKLIIISWKMSWIPLLSDLG